MRTTTNLALHDLDVCWGAAALERIDELETLDRVLDALDAEARAAGVARNVDLVTEAGTLSLVVGADESVLGYTPPDGRPPYRCSVGDEAASGSVGFEVGDGHHSEMPRRCAIASEVAREAARTFAERRELDERVRWERCA